MYDLTADIVRHYLDYDPETGAFTWRVKASSRASVGAPAGYSRSDGYRLIGLRGKVHLAHRLAWLHTQGTWPANSIDHINGDPSDNRLVNLREATHAQNLSNRPAPTVNTSGFKGVTWSKKDRRWQAQIKAQGRYRYLGQFTTREAAHAAYRTAATELHGDFARVA